MKKNKFFKALGVGAVATLGLFTIAGCSLSDDEKADVMEGLENANTYMEETIDLLKEQNRKLNEQNNQLEEYINEVQKENAKITAKEAWNKILLAKANFDTNHNGIRNNVRLEGIMSVDGSTATQQIVQECYRTENNGYVSYFKEYDKNENDLEYYYTSLSYEDAGNVYNYNYVKDEEDGEEGNSKYLDEICQSAESEANLDSLLKSFLCLLDELSAKNIVSVEILENGNYKITLFYTTTDEDDDEKWLEQNNFIFEYEINYENNFVNFKGSWISFETAKDDNDSLLSYNVETYHMETKLEYGVIEEDYINELLNEAKAAELTSEE